MKKKILFINSVCGFGSTGRIVCDLAGIDEYESLVCFGRKKDFANVNSYQFANFFDNASSALQTILFNNNLNTCKGATKKLINKIKDYNPDIIHLHNLHGYYVNIEMLFNFLKEYNKPVVWTLHDCWSFTGYCPHFENIGCNQYQTECKDCPYGFKYPSSLFKQNLNQQFNRKKELFNSIDNLTIVTPSNWLANLVKKSYLKDKNIVVINNGINLTDFKPVTEKSNEFSVLVMSNIWNADKGLNELNKIIPLLNENIKVTVVGTNSDKVNNCKTIAHTENKEELIRLYSSSHILINPTLNDNFPTVNIESLACGTPVVTYNTGGSPESLTDKTGIVVEKGNYQKMADTINELYKNNPFTVEDCVNQSKKFDINVMKEKYKELYESLLAK